MNTTVQTAQQPNSPAKEDHVDAIGNALLAIERLFRASAARAQAEGADLAEACSGDLELLQMWLPELYDRFTNPARVLEDLAADHDIEIRTTASPAVTHGCLQPDKGLFLVPAGLPPAQALAHLRAALTERGQA